MYRSHHGCAVGDREEEIEAVVFAHLAKCWIHASEQKLLSEGESQRIAKFVMRELYSFGGYSLVQRQQV